MDDPWASPEMNEEMRLENIRPFDDYEFVAEEDSDWYKKKLPDSHSKVKYELPVVRPKVSKKSIPQNRGGGRQQRAEHADADLALSSIDEEEAFPSEEPDLALPLSQDWDDVDGGAADPQELISLGSDDPHEFGDIDLPLTDLVTEVDADKPEGIHALDWADLDDDGRAFVREAIAENLANVSNAQSKRAQLRMERAPLLETFLREWTQKKMTVLSLVQPTVAPSEDNTAALPAEGAPMDTLKVASPTSANADVTDPLDDITQKYEMQLHLVSDQHLSQYEKYSVPLSEYEVYLKHVIAIQLATNLCDDFWTALKKYAIALRRYPAVSQCFPLEGPYMEGGYHLKYEMLHDITVAKAAAFDYVPSIQSWRDEYTTADIITSNITDTLQQRLNFLKAIPLHGRTHHSDATLSIYRAFDRLTSQLLSAFNVACALEERDDVGLRVRLETEMRHVSESMNALGWEEWRNVNLHFVDFAAGVEIACAYRDALEQFNTRDTEWDLVFDVFFKFEKKYQRKLESARKYWAKRKEARKQRKPLETDKAHLRSLRHINLTEVHPSLLALAADCTCTDPKVHELAHTTARALSFSPKYTLIEKQEAMKELVGMLNDTFFMEHGGITKEEYDEAMQIIKDMEKGSSKYLITPDHPLFGDKPDPDTYLPKGWDLSEAVGFTGKFTSKGGAPTSSGGGASK